MQRLYCRLILKALRHRSYMPYIQAKIQRGGSALSVNLTSLQKVALLKCLRFNLLNILRLLRVHQNLANFAGTRDPVYHPDLPSVIDCALSRRKRPSPPFLFRSQLQPIILRFT